MSKDNLYTKDFYEQYAKLCLEHTYDNKYHSLLKGESPDWQSSELNIGVEITQGISRTKGQSRAAMASYFGTGFPAEFIPQEINEPNVIIPNQESGISSLVDITGKQVKKAYLSKTKKLNSHYSLFNSNQLFIYAFKSLSENDLRKCFEIDLRKFRVNFDVCYINCIDRMYVCNFVRRTILDTIQINLPELIHIKTQALMQTTHITSAATKEKTKKQ